MAMFSSRHRVVWIISSILCVAAQDAVPVQSTPNSGVNVGGVIGGVIVGVVVAYVAVMVIYCMWCKKRNKMDEEKGDDDETEKKESAKFKFSLPFKSTIKLFNSSQSHDGHDSKDSKETRMENVYDQVGPKDTVKPTSVGPAQKQKPSTESGENEDLPPYSPANVGADQGQINRAYTGDGPKVERQQMERVAKLAQAEDESDDDDDVRPRVYRREAWQK